MAFEVVTVVNGSVAEMTLTGELDAAAAPQFQEALGAVADGKPGRLVLRVAGLAYLASAGVRMLIFAKQKLGPGVDVYVIGPQEMVLETIRRAGLSHSVIIQDESSAAG
jgi:anti-anti-sigma factor